ncbi:hypothetical protein [Methylobacter sp.]|uniref:hypothetical protein n=1 Tax=Methylobacter sp. TaxID=2051955 RepID=UPI00248856A1|nr:hypothetical protein [Methylobacter sp.]MDI1275849.1 hypothetical protein [Methylobacter sp.]MDI1356591.1 hypothetical protein [Methylobacter sp.]
MLKQIYKIAFCVIVFGAFTFNAHAADNQCMPIGGTGLGDAMNETHFVAAMSGTFTGAHAQVTNRKPTETGLILDIEHYFISDKGGFLKTKDKATLTAVPGKDQVYMIEITYNVIEALGAYTGYKGTFNSFGLMKLGEGKVIVRYTGELCK